jgi:predicted Ser/Thr protein kinase/ribosomal protein L7/L12
MTEEKQCPQCGAELPENAPGGVCPKCIMKLGLPTGVDPEKFPMQDAQGAMPTGTKPLGGFVPPEPADLGAALPELEVLELLGQGGMGAVYKARQTRLDRLVAVKILPPEVGKDPAFAERFEREVRSLAKLNHPHIVTLYEFGQTDDGVYYFIMEFVDGTDLRHVIQAGDLGADEALLIVPQICEALQYAHEEGVVHRDVKPENIFLDKKGRVKIGDFGLAKLLDRPATAYTLTQVGQKMGTPHYMAPEQIEGAHGVDHRADIYSLGVVFYEMLTGQLPIGRFVAPSQKVQVDVRLDKVVLKSLEYEPERRYQHASEVQSDVESIAVGVAPSPASGSTDTVEDGSLEQCVLSQLPCTKIEAAKAYREKTGAGRVEAALAVDAITRKHGVQFKRVPLKIGRVLTFAATLGIYTMCFFLFRRHVQLSAVLGWSIAFIAMGCLFVFFSVAAWRSRSIDKGLQFRLYAGFFLFMFLINPLLILLLKPMPILDRLYDLADATPGQHDVLFLRFVLIAIIIIGLFRLVQLWRKFRTSRKANASSDPPLGQGGKASRDVIQPTRARKKINPAFVVGVIVTLVVVLAILVPVAYFFIFLATSRMPQTGRLNSRTDGSVHKMGQLDFPYGTSDYIEWGPTGPSLSEPCVETLDLKPSELVAVNSILQSAHQKYSELEDSRTTKKRTGDHLEVTITPFRDEALAFLEQLWADLDEVLDIRKKAIARRHLPLGRMFGTFEFGEPTVTMVFDKQGGTFNYKITYQWPEGTGKSGGGMSGLTGVLSPEYRRFWDDAQVSE